MTEEAPEGSVDDWLDRLAAAVPAPGGGAAAALAVAMGAALAAMSARLSEGVLEGAAQLAAHADALRRRAAALAAADGVAYEKVLAARRLPVDSDPQTRESALRDALGAASDVPLEVATLGAEVGRLCLALARGGRSSLEGDALTGALLAAAGARSAATLVVINMGAADDRAERAEREAEAAGSSARRALETREKDDGGEHSRAPGQN